MEREYGFLSHLIPSGMKKSVYENSKNNMQDAADALQWHIYHGLCQNLNCDIKIINALPISSFPQYYKKAFIRRSQFDTAYNTGNVNMGFCNVKLIREYSKTASAYRELKRWLDTSNAGKTLFLYTASCAFLKAIARLKERYDLRVCVIIADLPDMISLSSKKSLLRKWIEKNYASNAYELLSSADDFVLLTKHMADYMDLKRPYCVMEGIATAQNEFSAPDYHNEIKTVFYAGTLHQKFGVLNLLEAFRQIEAQNYRLVLCGAGDSEKEIIEAATQDERILFCGQLMRPEVLKIQSKATVLVNPRQNNEEFTRYSFPSKNLEYLSSGVPFIAYKLDGIPDEYDEHIFYVEDNDVGTLAKKIVEVCEKSAEEREAIGRKARAFVTEQKNEIVQTRKIISFLDRGDETDGSKTCRNQKNSANPN